MSALAEGHSLPASVRAALHPPEVLPAGPAGRLAAAGRRLVGSGLHLLYPPHCLSCGAPLARGAALGLCLRCAGKIQWVGQDRCGRCGAQAGAGQGVTPGCRRCASRPPAYIGEAVVLARFGGPLRDLILGLKFGGEVQVVPLLGLLLAKRVEETGLLRRCACRPLLLPVPLARGDFVRRGFNQAEELARVVGRRLGIPVERRLLRKTRSTPPQATLSHTQRRENLEGAFLVEERRFEGMGAFSAILVDDVLTTLATVSECARALNRKGVRQIHALAVARG